MRRARRTDANHAAIRNLLRALCHAVEDLSDVGRGLPDLLVKTTRGSVFLVEVKDGSKSPSKRKLTEHEIEMARKWQSSYMIVESEDDAIKLARL